MALGTGSLVLLGLDPIIGVLAVLTAGPMILRDWLIEAKRRELEEAEWLTRRKKIEVSYELTSTDAGLRSRLWKLTGPYHAYFRELVGELINNAMTLARFDRRWNLSLAWSRFARLLSYADTSPPDLWRASTLISNWALSEGASRCSYRACTISARR